MPVAVLEQPEQVDRLVVRTVEEQGAAVAIGDCSVVRFRPFRIGLDRIGSFLERRVLRGLRERIVIGSRPFQRIEGDLDEGVVFP